MSISSKNMLDSKTTQPPEQVAELQELQKKFAVLDQERKNHYQRTQQQRTLNKTSIAKYQKENKEMREMINMLKEKEKTTRKGDNDGETIVRSASNGERDLFFYRQKFDDLKSKSFKKEEVKKGIEEKLEALQKQQDSMTQNSPSKSSKTGGSGGNNSLKQIRMLENRLDKAMIKFNEAISIKKTYEIILKRLKEEKIAYDQQLRGMEKAIKAKNADFDELLMLSHDANHARELADQDLRGYENQINNMRQTRMQDIQNQKVAVEDRVNRQNQSAKVNLSDDITDPKMLNQDLTDQPAEQKKPMPKKFGFANINRGINNKLVKIEYESFRQRLIKATGLTETNAIIHQFATQEETQKNLKDLKDSNEKKLMNLTEKRQNVKDDLEKMKLEGLEAMTRKQVDDMERNLAQAEHKHEKAKESYDKEKKMLLDLQAGIEHLCGKLNEIKIQDPSGQIKNIDYVTQDNLVEGLEQSRQKLKILYRDLKQDPELFKQSMEHVRGGGFGGNQDKLFKNADNGNYFKELRQNNLMGSNKSSHGNSQSQGGGPPVVSQNVRVQLPEDEDQDDMSDINLSDELAEEEIERIKIKHKNETMRKAKKV